MSPKDSFANNQLDVLRGLSPLWKMITRRVEDILQSLGVCERQKFRLGQVHFRVRRRSF
jgi:hypothetical protein